MKKIIICDKGHKYDSEKYSECPYCPENIIAKNVFDYRDTKIEGIKPTVTKNICDSYKDTSLVEEYINKDIIELEMNHTKIMNSENFQENDRRIVGFLITYDIKKNGDVFYLYEGRNVIGSTPECDIVVSNDSMISEKHLTILYRDNQFLFRDEFSTNGTYINNKMQSDGVLENNSIIGIGNKKLYFIMVPLYINDKV